MKKRKYEPMPTYRYYSPDSEIMPWNPIVSEKWLLTVQNWTHKRYVSEIGRPAWGYVEVGEELTDEELERYGLIRPGEEEAGV